MFKKLIRAQFNKRNLAVVRNEVLAYPINALNEYINVETQNKIDSIIFSKDRAIQLHAFIESYFEKVDGADTLYVIYKATGAHAKSYEELKDIWAAEPVIFVNETNFRDQLNEIVSQSRAKLIGFYVDDMIFTRNVSYEEILSFDPLKYIVSLSRGLDFTYSQVLDKAMELPHFTKIENSEFYSYNWNYSTEFNDWTYPLGVSAYFYSRHEIAAMFNLIPYKAPNSLENIMQLMKPYFIGRKGLCMDTVGCVCVPVNLVQQECVNPVTGFATIDELLEKWNEGLKIKTADFNGVGVNGIYMNYNYISR